MFAFSHHTTLISTKPTRNAPRQTWLRRSARYPRGRATVARRKTNQECAPSTHPSPWAAAQWLGSSGRGLSVPKCQQVGWLGHTRCKWTKKKRRVHRNWFQQRAGSPRLSVQCAPKALKSLAPAQSRPPHAWAKLRLKVRTNFKVKKHFYFF